LIFLSFYSPDVDDITQHATLLRMYIVVVDASADEKHQIRGNSEMFFNNAVILTHDKLIIHKKTFNYINTSALHRLFYR
jgi:hypothetical protein